MEFDEMTESELRSGFDIAKVDLEKAAEDEPNSEWHQSCFAAVYLYASELERRGLKLQTVH